MSTPNPATSAPPSNGDVARVFERIADIMEVQGENQFKIRAYRNAVHTLRTHPEPIAQVAAEDRLGDIPGFGEAIRAKTMDILKTGTTPLHERLKDQVPEGVIGLLGLPGVGAKMAQQLWKGGIESVEALQEAIASGSILNIKGLGEKTIQKLQDSIERAGRYGSRVRIDEALDIAVPLVAALRARPEVAQADYAGSLRRGVETVGDIDLVAASSDMEATIAAFVALPQVDSIVNQGEQMARVSLHSGMEVDLKLVPPGQYGALLHDFTGSREHNIRLREMAEARGLKINQHGVTKDGVALDLPDDEDAVYTGLGLPPIPVHIRENTGEIEAAIAGTLPKLITRADIRGDVHAHTTASDGKASVRDMALAAKALGYEYMAITDHSCTLTIANGLTPERLRAQIREVRALEDSLGIRVFCGTECDVLADGALDFDDDLLADLDFVIASAHRFNNQDAEAQTKRYLRVIENPHVDLIAHPTARLVNRRDPFDFDLETVVDAVIRADKALEINAAPERLDLKDTHARFAAERGAMIMIDTDAHRPEEYQLMPYGITVARRAWLEPKNVLNCRPLAEFEAWLKR